MSTTSFSKSGRQIALPIHLHQTSIVVVDVKIRTAVVMALARLLLDAAAANGRREGVPDEP